MKKRTTTRWLAEHSYMCNSIYPKISKKDIQEIYKVFNTTEATYCEIDEDDGLVDFYVVLINSNSF